MEFLPLNRRNEILPSSFLNDSIYCIYPIDSLNTNLPQKNDAFKVDMYSTKNSYVIQADLAGFKKENISASLLKNALTIEANNKSTSDSSQEDKIKYLLKERKQGKFSRTLMLPTDANLESIKSEYRDGILELTCERVSDENSKRKITIE